MKKIIILILSLIIISGCSKKDDQKINKIITCSNNSVSDSIETQTDISASFHNSDLIVASLKSTMTYEDEKMAKRAYNIYVDDVDENHNVKIYLDENKILMEINFPGDGDQEYIASELRSLTLKGSCSVEYLKD